MLPKGSSGEASLFVSIADNRITHVIEKLNFKTYLTLFMITVFYSNVFGCTFYKRHKLL